MLCYIMEGLALEIGIDRLSPAKALGSGSWIITQFNR